MTCSYDKILFNLYLAGHNILALDKEKWVHKRGTEIEQKRETGKSRPNISRFIYLFILFLD